MIFILREFGANYAYELEPWWDSPWVKWPVAGVFATGFFALLFWMLFAYMPRF